MATVVGLPASNEGLSPSLFNSPPLTGLDTYCTLPSIVPLQCVLVVSPLYFPPGPRARLQGLGRPDLRCRCNGPPSQGKVGPGHSQSGSENGAGSVIPKRNVRSSMCVWVSERVCVSQTYCTSSQFWVSCVPSVKASLTRSDCLRRKTAIRLELPVTSTVQYCVSLP